MRGGAARGCGVRVGLRSKGVEVDWETLLQKTLSGPQGGYPGGLVGRGHIKPLLLLRVEVSIFLPACLPACLPGYPRVGFFVEN